MLVVYFCRTLISQQCRPIFLYPDSTRRSVAINLLHSRSLIAPSDMLHLIFETSFLHHSEFLVQIIHKPLSEFHFNMLPDADLTCYTLLSLLSLFPFSLWAQNLPFQKYYPAPYIVCFCLSDWSRCSRPITGFLCASVFMFLFYLILSVLVIPTRGRLSWPTGQLFGAW